MLLTEGKKLKTAVKGFFHVVYNCRDLLVLWLLGMVSSYTMGGLVHVVLVVALVIFVVGLLQGRKA